MIAETGNQIVVIVEDEGPGIPLPDMERVFQPFVRLEESRGRNTGGTGLGLTIAASVIQTHGGLIALANRTSGGLAVTVTLSKVGHSQVRPAPHADPKPASTP
jgi:signal transduction histidine kinase